MKSEISVMWFVEARSKVRGSKWFVSSHAAFAYRGNAVKIARSASPERRKMFFYRAAKYVRVAR